MDLFNILCYGAIYLAAGILILAFINWLYQSIPTRKKREKQEQIDAEYKRRMAESRRNVLNKARKLRELSSSCTRCGSNRIERFRVRDEYIYNIYEEDGYESDGCGLYEGAGEGPYFHVTSRYYVHKHVMEYEFRCLECEHLAFTLQRGFIQQRCFWTTENKWNPDK